MEHKQPPFNLMERGGTGVKKKNERRKRGYGVAARLIAFIVSLFFLTQGIGQGTDAYGGQNYCVSWCSAECSPLR